MSWPLGRLLLNLNLKRVMTLIKSYQFNLQELRSRRDTLLP